MSRNRLAVGVAVVLAVVGIGSAAFVAYQSFWRPKTITAYFTTATAIYPGDQVRVSGVKVGKITSIRPEGDLVRVTMNVDRDVRVPADAKAVIVAQNLVSARYVQLTPAYHGGGQAMRDGAVIPVGRTAVPVEWDEVKTQLTRLATDLGPNSQVSTPSVARFIDSAANALSGNGEKLRRTLAELSGVGRILANGSGNIVDIINNLQVFVTALRDSNEQVVSFENRLATLTSVLDDGRSDLDAALTDLSSVVGEVQRFVSGSRDQLSEQVQRLADVTKNLVDHRTDLENLLHVAPNAFANFYNAYNPDTGDTIGSIVFNNFSNPLQFICSQIGALENATAPETGKLCAQYLGPALRSMSFNYLPIPTSMFLMKSASPDNIVYSEPRLAPGGEGPKPTLPLLPPAVSAYGGLPGDTPPAAPPPPPPGRIPGLAQPEPPPTTATGTEPQDMPAREPANVQDMLLPAAGVQP
ncbi:MCE family protein [Mycobacterium sp. 1081908.1]|uniref:MCE family protein n=1 Tax=Mycobacterium sp. 1081908.1 TaxID=1834066 RepID=UPI0008010CA9|nr:MCE family protein [Mycobacterium sp. 1081908.1]OBK44514.1 mammalian cell entry protein [Mycobacterium sp. 1081908.1]